MSGPETALVGFAFMIALIALRVPVGLAMLGVGAAGYAYLAGGMPLLNLVKTTPYYLFANYTLSVIPLFILMGAFAERSGMSAALFTAANALVGHRRGGIAMATIGACTAFGAICGSSVATTATMARAALPAFRRYGYSDTLATGAVAVGGTLGILIPPSVILVVYAIATEQNIAKLFMAALIPGLLAAVFYLCAIRWVVLRRADSGPAAPRVAAREK
nr:TRAP transporter large permease subunit [Hyphomicrobiales bacterium]